MNQCIAKITKYILKHSQYEFSDNLFSCQCIYFDIISFIFKYKMIIIVIFQFF